MITPQFIMLIIAACFPLYVWVRGGLALKFSEKIMDRMQEIARKEIRSGDYDTWEKRFVVFYRVSFYFLLFAFWKPLRIESFWAPSEVKFLTEELPIPKKGKKTK